MWLMGDDGRQIRTDRSQKALEDNFRHIETEIEELASNKL